MQQTLIKIEALLRKYDFTIEANILASNLALYEQDETQAYEKMIEDSWWTGEDAVAEANLSIGGGFSAEARQDQDRFQQLIIELYQRLIEAGYDTDHGKLVASQYQKWLASRVQVLIPVTLIL